MDRRQFNATSLGLVATAFAIKPMPSRDWRMIVGGNMSGKSTIAANIARKSRSACVLGYDLKHTDYLKTSFHLDIPGISSGFLDSANEDESLCGDFLWIDEGLRSFDFIPLAERFDRVLWVSWPSSLLIETEFYKFCESAGTIDHITMRPEFRRQLQYCEYSERDYKRRVLGVFA